MIERVASAGFRAFLVAMMIATPFLLLPEAVGDATALIVLLALLAALLIFLEYTAECPSVVEFRQAAPLNRLRFALVFAVLLCVSLMLRATGQGDQMSRILVGLGHVLGHWGDFPYSPVRLALLALPQDAPPALVANLRVVSTLSYLISAVAVLVFLFLVRFTGWPFGKGGFNVFVNLPMFDPTKGDVLVRLTRDARINVLLGILLPFLIPAVIKGSAGVIDPLVLQQPLVLVWAMVIWACLPAIMIMRGVAIGRIAEMIGEKRRRAYAEAEAKALQSA